MTGGNKRCNKSNVKQAEGLQKYCDFSLCQWKPHVPEGCVFCVTATGVPCIWLLEKTKAQYWLQRFLKRPGQQDLGLEVAVGALISRALKLTRPIDFE